MRSHGGRVRAIESGETHIDMAFIGAPTCDPMGNCRAVGGKSDCGVLSYSMVDAQYADYVVAITDTLVPFPNIPASISMTDVDAVVVVDAIGDPVKIATGPAKPTTDMRKLLMARYTTEFLIHTPYYKEGFSYQTGAGGASLASTGILAEHMRKDGIHMGLALGGITKTMCDMMDEGLIDRIVDAQVFDTGAIESIKNHPGRHIEISTSEYADPFNKASYVNHLDFVILASLEVDTHFNCNVVVDSSGMVTGAQGGHPDTAAGGPMHHRHRTAAARPHSCREDRMHHHYHAGRDSGRCHHGLWHRHQSQASGPHRRHERCRPSLLYHRRTARQGLCHCRRPRCRHLQGPHRRNH